MLSNLSAPDDEIRGTARNNLGSSANRTVFCAIMSPSGGKPDGEILAAIDLDLWSLEKLRPDFYAAGGRQFGSGECS